MKCSFSVHKGLCVVCMLLVSSSLALAGGGNSEDANKCKKDGYKSLKAADGSLFRNQGDCVSYVVRGGKFKAAGGIFRISGNVPGYDKELSFTYADRSDGNCDVSNIVIAGYAVDRLFHMGDAEVIGYTPTWRYVYTYPGLYANAQAYDDGGLLFNWLYESPFVQ